MIMLVRLLYEYSLSNALDLLSPISSASKLFLSLGRLGTTGLHGENSFHHIYERKYMRQVFRTLQDYSLLFCVNARCSLGLLLQSTCNEREKTLSALISKVALHSRCLKKWTLRKILFEASLVKWRGKALQGAHYFVRFKIQFLF